MIRPEDLQYAEGLGYTFNRPQAETKAILDKYFDGIDMPVLTDDLDRLLNAHAKEPITREIIVTDPPPFFKIEYLSDDFMDDDSGLQVSRIFLYENNELIVEHEYLVLPKSCRGQRIGTKVLAAFLEQYENMNVKKIKVHAGLEDGGIVWARVGFKATEKWEMERILQTAKEQLPIGSKILNTVQDTFDSYYGN